MPQSARIVKEKQFPDLLAQLERVQIRYSRYQPDTSMKIASILSNFCSMDFDDAFLPVDSENQQKISDFPMETLRTRYELLQNFNVENDTKRGLIDYLYLSLRRGGLVRPDSFPKIYENINYLTEVGFTHEEVRKFLMVPHPKWSSTNYLSYKPSRNKQYFDLLREEIGLENEQIKKFIMCCQTFFYHSLENYRDKIEHLIHRGFTKQRLTDITTGFPQWLYYSSARLDKTLDTLNDKGKVNLILKEPILFYFNPTTPFFERLRQGVAKNHKRYTRILERVKERKLAQEFVYMGYGRLPLEEEKYLRELQEYELHHHYIFHNNDTYVASKIATAEQYVGKNQTEFISRMYYTYKNAIEFSPDEKRALEFVCTRLQEKNPDLYRSIRKLFGYMVNGSFLVKDESIFHGEGERVTTSPDTPF